MPTFADATTIRGAVGEFLDRILADPELERYWVGVDVARVRRHAQVFIVQALGGPDLYDGDIRAAHADLGIDDADYDHVAAELVAALRDAGVSTSVVDLARQRVEELRRVIVTA